MGALMNTAINHDNCTWSQGRVIRELKAMRDIIIKPSDKGGNVVIWPLKAYEREAYRQGCEHVQCYQKLTFNPLEKFQSELHQMLHRAVERSFISKKQADFLTVTDPKIATFYMLSKVHKNITTPIVSGRGNICESICRFIDLFLQPIVETLPYYLKDTNDILWKMEGMQLDPNMMLVTADVESLYTSIRHKDGIMVVWRFLFMSDLDKDLCDLIVQLLEFVLTHNFFLFKESLFLQLQGTAMGAACVPSYANLFLGLWDRGIFCTDLYRLLILFSIGVSVSMTSFLSGREQSRNSVIHDLIK